MLLRILRHEILEILRMDVLASFGGLLKYLRRLCNELAQQAKVLSSLKTICSSNGESSLNYLQNLKGH